MTDESTFVSEVLPELPNGWRWQLSSDHLTYSIQKDVQGVWVHAGSIAVAMLYRKDKRDYHLQRIMENLDFEADRGTAHE